MIKIENKTDTYKNQKWTPVVGEGEQLFYSFKTLTVLFIEGHVYVYNWNIEPS